MNFFVVYSSNVQLELKYIKMYKNSVFSLSPVAKILKYDLKFVENFHERFCLKGKKRNKNGNY